MREMPLQAAAVQALAVLDLPPAMEKIVITPQREMTVELIINRDDGKPESFMGYRVQVHSLPFAT